MTQLPRMGTIQPVMGNKPLKVIPNFELIAVNDAVIQQNEFGPTKTLNISSTQVSGEIIGVKIISSKDGNGEIIKEPLDLFFFRSDPTISAGDNALMIAQANGCEGHIHIASGDWAASMSGTDTAGLASVPTAFSFQTDSSGNLYVAIAHRGPTTINSDAGDDEQIEATFHIRLDD